MRTTWLCVASLAAAHAAAQAPVNVIGTSRSVDTSHLARFDAMPAPGGTANVDYLNRLDFRDHRFYYLDANGDMRIAGMETALHDENDQTTESYDLVFYEEDIGNPGYPDPFGPMMRLGPIPMPPPWDPQNPSITWYIGIGFGPALTVPYSGQTLFYGLGLPPAPGQSFPNDGLSALVLTDSTNDPVHDVAGRGIQNLPHGTPSLWQLTSGGFPSAPAQYLGGTPGNREWFYCDLGGEGAGGTPLAHTNQASYWISNPGPWGPTGNGGTTSPFSGLDPDVIGTHAGRQDDVGFLFYDQSMIGGLAMIMVSLDGLPNAFPLSLIFDPASYGAVCIDTTVAIPFFGLIDQNGFASAQVPLSPGARAIVQVQAGLDLWWQGFALDLSGPNVLVHASGCALQHL